MIVRLVLNVSKYLNQKSQMQAFEFGQGCCLWFSVGIVPGEKLMQECTVHDFN